MAPLTTVRTHHVLTYYRVRVGEGQEGSGTVERVQERRRERYTCS